MGSQSSQKATWWSLCLLVITLAAGLRLYHLDFGLPQRLHPDEWSQVEIAWQISQGDLNPHFFRYPSGMMYLLAACFKVLLAISPGASLPDLYLAGRTISALFGAGTVGLVIAWGCLLWGRWPGLLAGGLMAILSTPVLHSHYATVDVLVTFWSTAALLAITRAVLQSDQLWLYLASLFTGLAIGVKYNAALLLLPLGIAWIALADQPQPFSAKQSQWTATFLLSGGAVLILLSAWLLASADTLLPWFAGLTSDGVIEAEYVSLLQTSSWLPGILGGLCLATAALLWKWPESRLWPRLLDASNLLPFLIVLVVFSLSSPFFWIAWRQSFQDVLYEIRHMQIGSAAQYAEGTLHYQEALVNPVNLFPAVGSMAQLVISDFGWLGLALILLGLPALWQRSRLLACLLSGLLLLTVLVTGTWANWSARYFLPAYPTLAILLAGGLGWIARWLKRVQPGLRWATMALLVLAMLAAPAVQTRRALADFTLPDTRELALNWIVKNIPNHSALARDTFTPDFESAAGSYAVIEGNPYVLADYTVEDLAKKGPPYVVTTFDPREAGTSSWVSRERLEEFLAAYQVLAVFQAEPGKAKGKTILFYAPR